jgi:glycosyltransferase involved in cell wall biosynthesis
MGASDMRTVVVVPVYNQAHELPHLIEELRSIPLPCDELLFVNDGSTDGSQKIIAETGWPSIDVPKNHGIGHSMMVAADWALTRDYDVFGVIAGNGKMLPSEMDRVVGPVRAGEYDYVTGSRYTSGGAAPNLPIFRRVTIPMVNVFVRSATGARVTDGTCGYAAFHLDLLRRATFDWHAEWLHTYGFEYYLRAKVVLDGALRWKEVPVTMRYPESGPYSKIPPVVGWYEMLRPWLVARVDGSGFGPPLSRAKRADAEPPRP